MLTVRQISTTDLAEDMRRIAVRIANDGLRPAYLLGILEGGRVPTAHLAAAMNAEDKVLLYRRQRPTTGRVKASVAKLAWRLPKVVRNWLWAIEISTYGMLAKRRTMSSEREAIDTELLQFIRSNIDPAIVTESTPLLIVDDAVDTGKTLLTLVSALEACGIRRERIRTAAVVQTLPSPVLRADYVAHSGVIIQFPWSGDYRGRSENRS